MIDSRLIQTLKTLTKDEFKQFEKFVASPFFNNGRNYLPFLKELKKNYPGFENKNDSLQPENIYKKIYPGRNFDKQVMWNMVSQLEKLAMEFLLHIALKGNMTQRYILIFDELSKRHLDKEIFKEIEKTDKYISNLKFGQEYFYLKFIAENSRAEYWRAIQGRRHKGVEARVKTTEYLLLNIMVYLSLSASGLKINFLYNAGNETKNAIELVKSLDLKNLVDVAKKNNHIHAPVMMFYYNKIMCALEEKEESYFFEMKKFFEENYNIFDRQEQSEIITTLANYCTFKTRQGNDKFLKIHFEISKFRLEKEIGACVNGRISKVLYNQILRNALSLGEIKWTENFVKEYTPMLKRELQKTMNSMAWGYIHHVEKNYVESLQCLNEVEFIDLRDKLLVRILTAQAYYDLNNTELLFYYIDSSKHFIGNNTVIESNTKEAYMKFFNFLNKLLTCKENPEQNKIKELREDLHFDQILWYEHKKWLLEKIDELFIK